MQRAVAVVAARAQARRDADHARLIAACAEADVDRLIDGLRQHGRLTLNFHPDRLSANGLAVAEGLATSGQYQPQSQTGISNGARFPVGAGDRADWESTLFSGVYDNTAAVRPVYGALDLTRDPHGGSPRFGSSFVVLRPHCLDRATLCVGDSHVGPTDVGTISEPLGLLAGLFEQGAAGNAMDRSLTTAGLIATIERAQHATQPARELDGYVEAQIHGPVMLESDVAAIVLDPSFVDSSVSVQLAEAADRYGFVLSWHRGSELAAVDVPADFRGPNMPALAEEVARPDGVLDAATLGRWAARIPWSEPEPDGDPAEGPRQQIKYLWHCLLRFGHDRPDAPSQPADS